MGFNPGNPLIGTGGPPSGGAGGDLAGNYPNPTIAKIQGTVVAGVTGTGNVVFSISPTITGHATIEGVTATGATGTGKFVFDTSPTLVTPILGVAAATTVNLSAVAPTVAAGHVGYGATVQTTVGAAGGASVLPVAPTGYLLINIAGTMMAIPYYASA